MQPGDIKIGMYLTNEGPGKIAMYSNLDGSGSPEFYVLPGELIGQIADIRQGAGGTVYDFVSDKITANGSIVEKAEYYVLGWLLDPVKIAAGVRFNDIKNNVTDGQIAEQSQALAVAEANGVSFKNIITKMAKNVGEGLTSVVTGVIPWGLIALFAGGWLLFTNREKISNKLTQ
jgi:hypothetical protein